ncbi:MAG: hypothetical protein HY920_08190, partial [Elusimicrobia bacterium]|nr:hypothetical protein [Elusimicrobiota bacterium]
MQKSVKLALKRLLVVLAGAIICALSYLLNWSRLVKLLMFNAKYWWLILIFFSAVNSIVRWKFLKKKPYWISILLIFMISSAWAMPVSGKPTLFFYLAFLFTTSIVAGLALDKCILLIQWLSSLPYVRFFRRPAGIFIFVLLSLLYLSDVFRHSDLRIIDLLIQNLFILAPLSALVYAYIRKKYYQKSPDVLKGLAIFILVFWVWPYYTVLVNSCLKVTNSFWVWVFGPNPWKSILLLSAKHHPYGNAVSRVYKSCLAFYIPLQSRFTYFTWLLFVAGWIVVFKEEIHGFWIKLFSTIKQKVALHTLQGKKESIRRFWNKMLPLAQAVLLKIKEHKRIV